MQFTGRCLDASLNMMTGKYNITFEINEKQALIDGFDKIKDCEKLKVEAVKFRERRSLDANAYCWVLLQKIAEATNADKWSIYLRCLQRYSRAFTHVIVKESALERMKELYRTSIDLGKVTVNGQTGHQLQVYYGSSSFDTKEMSVFIDGIVSECKELGISTMTPEEVERLKTAWQKG